MAESGDDDLDTGETVERRADLGLVRRPRPGLVPADVMDLYEVWEYRHAAAILHSEFPDEYSEILNALRTFRFTDAQVRKGGGNESDIPKTFSRMLRPNWQEMKLRARLAVDETDVSIDTHLIDYVRNGVAFDLEWNAKDQTFDRDLAAFRAFFEYGRVSVGVLVTRDPSLVPYFKQLGNYINKYGQESPVVKKYGEANATTTHMNKLLPRLRAGRSGGCPVLAFGITPKLRSEEP